MPPEKDEFPNPPPMRYAVTGFGIVEEMNEEAVRRFLIMGTHSISSVFNLTAGEEIRIRRLT